jgi:hypothetical protein
MSTRINKPKWRQIEEIRARHFKWLIMALDTIIVIAFVGLVWLGINIVQMHLPKGGEYVYNCSVAEIHPDFTPAMQRACRKQFNKETQNDL